MSLCTFSALGAAAFAGSPPAPGFKALESGSAKPANGRVWWITVDGGVLYMCGTFNTTYNSNTRTYVATYTIATGAWAVLGNGYLAGTDMRQIAVHNGVVYVAGNFTSVEIVGKSTLTTSALARYTIGTDTWSAIGSGVSPSNTYGRGVVVDSTGTYLYFLCSGISTMNGTATGQMTRIQLSNNAVTNMSSGYVTNCDGLGISASDEVFALTPATGVIKWSGSSWAALGGGTPNNLAAYGIAFGPGGSTLVGYGGAVWYSADGATGWTELGTSSGSFYGVAIDPDSGTLYSSAGQNNTPVRVWSGSAWDTLATVTGYVRAYGFSGGRMYVGGSFTVIGGLTTTNTSVYY